MSKGNDLIERLRNLGDRDLSDEIDIIDWLTQESERLFINPNEEEAWLSSQLFRAASTIASLSEALAEAEKKGAEDGWMPIETAPRDGTEFLGAYLERHRDIQIVKCWYQPEFEAFISSARVMALAPGYTFEDGSSEQLHSPEIEPVTHWMKLWELHAPPRDLSQGGKP